MESKKKIIIPIIIIAVIAVIVLISNMFNVQKKEAETEVVQAEEAIEDTEVKEETEVEPEETKTKVEETEEDSENALSGSGEYNPEEEDAFYNDDEVYEAEKNNNSETQTPSETAEKPEGWHTGDDLDAYLDSVGGTEIIYTDEPAYPGDDYDMGW